MTRASKRPAARRRHPVGWSLLLVLVLVVAAAGTVAATTRHHDRGGDVNGRWKSLPRLDDNFFVSPTGAGCGGSIRITDPAGHRITDAGISVSPNKVQPGHTQFPAA